MNKIKSSYYSLDPFFRNFHYLQWAGLDKSQKTEEYLLVLEVLNTAIALLLRLAGKRPFLTQLSLAGARFPALGAACICVDTWLVYVNILRLTWFARETNQKKTALILRTNDCWLARSIESPYHENFPRVFWVNYTGMAPEQKERYQFSHKVAWISAVTSSRTSNEKKTKRLKFKLFSKKIVIHSFDTNASLLDNQ